MEFIQKNKVYIIIGLLIVSIITAIIICTSLLKPSSDDTTYDINSTFYPTLKISGELLDDKLNGYTVIESENNDFKLTGTFKDGVFKEGNISLINKNVEYYLEGSFNNFNLQEGDITIITEDKIITKSGFFIDNKLDGTGFIKIQDKQTGEVLFNYAGKFENDKPIY